jgi:hypothetical protein
VIESKVLAHYKDRESQQEASGIMKERKTERKKERKKNSRLGCKITIKFKCSNLKV